jgi:hypothetical protein
VHLQEVERIRNTKVYIFEGTDPSGQSKWCLADATSVAENRTHSIYETAESQGNMCGMRVTLNCGFVPGCSIGTLRY